MSSDQHLFINEGSYLSVPITINGQKCIKQISVPSGLYNDASITAFATEQVGVPVAFSLESLRETERRTVQEEEVAPVDPTKCDCTCSCYSCNCEDCPYR